MIPSKDYQDKMKELAKEWNRHYMIFKCKAKNLNQELARVWMANTIPVEPLESIDFSKN